jgi:hypothetical protein
MKPVPCIDQELIGTKRIKEGKDKVAAPGIENDAKSLSGLDREAVEVTFASAQLAANAVAGLQQPGFRVFLVQ